jgi:hypothetical protein
MGELLRRYWQPVWTSDELLDLPRKGKLLCEELVLFHDRKGRVGASTRMRASRHLARMGPRRRGGTALLLSRLAL